jgi:YrbI family 3-deoxy-D-manno-octulosonate 8-phosphate phosphatase
MSILAIIPARGGSKGIPRKNLCLIAGKPLLGYSIEQARRTPAITKVVVSTDDREIGAVATSFGAEVVWRPKEISGDDATSESALLHALDEFQTAKGHRPDLVVFLQCTSPLRQPDDIGNAIDVLIREGADSVFSACHVEGFVWRHGDRGTEGQNGRGAELQNHKSLAPTWESPSTLRHGSEQACSGPRATSSGADVSDSERGERGQAQTFLSPVNYDPTHRPRRQELTEGILEENGSIYVFKPEILRTHGSRFGGKIAYYLMSRLDSFQVDEPRDISIIEHLMAIRGTPGAMDTAAVSGVRGPATGVQSTDTPAGLQGPGSRSPVRVSMAPDESGSVSAPSPYPLPRGGEGEQQPVCHSALTGIRLLVLDFDGVMTDNRVWVDQDGRESVACDRADGLGIARLRRAGIEVVVLSTETNPVVAARCRKLGIACIQGCADKLAVLKKLAAERSLREDQIAYVGNDINDLECMGWVGVPVAVADAVPEVRAAAKLITFKPGGAGAVREVAEWILDAQKERGASSE